MSKASTKVPKSKSMMYEQQLRFLPDGVEGLIKDVKALEPKMWAVAVHDKDVHADGEPVEDHVHVMMTFTNARSPNAIARALRDKPQYIEVWRGDRRNGYAYLCHRTDGARAKYQYDPGEVVANFDYVVELESYEAGATAGRKAAAMPVLLDALYRGDLTRDELTESLTGSQIAASTRAISNVLAEKHRRDSIEWRKHMQAAGKTLQVYWLWGRSGTGKSSYARALAAELSPDGRYFMSGSSRGVFEGYDGEHVLILDELSPGDVPYSDLKRILDPYSTQDSVRAPARYNDAHLMAELFIITSPFSPLELYQQQVYAAQDRFDQLVRRITYPVMMQQHQFELMEFDRRTQRFLPVSGSSQTNPYSELGRSSSAVSTDDRVSSFVAINKRLKAA